MLSTYVIYIQDTKLGSQTAVPDKRKTQPQGKNKLQTMEISSFNVVGNLYSKLSDAYQYDVIT